MNIANDNQRDIFKLNNYLLSKKEEDGEVQYFENNQLLTSVDKEGKERSFTKEEFEIKLKSKVKTYINKKYDNIILLTGAGSSINKNSDKGNIYGKTMLELWEPIRTALKGKSTVFSLEELSGKINFDLLTNGSSEITSNLEDFMTQLLQYEHFINDCEVLTKYKKTVDEIYKEIVKNTSYTYDSEDFNHSAIIKLLNEMLTPPSRLTVVTTNYDLLFEQAAEEINYTVIDGFTFSQKPKFNSDLYNWNLVKPVPNVSTKELEYNKNVISLLKIHGSILWFEENDEIYRRQESIDKIPVMIFPNTKKYAQSYKTPYFALFSKFQELLNVNNSLIISSGFSFGDLHITSILENAIKNNNGLQLLITDFDINNKDTEGWTMLEKLSNKQYPVGFLETSFNELINYLEEI